MQVNPVSLLRYVRALWRRWRRRHERAVEYAFWGLVHDHTWLQYDPPKGGE